ncbi:hypothetical protein [Abditibacterium utsteinense]|nr:hypothetical protein [Abditibacterium utsteinense]
MKKIRQIHFYLGVLFAPSILFFALTGAIQTFRWQENGAAGGLTPVLSQMASIHKDSALERAEKPRPRAPRAEAAPPAEARKPESDGEAGGQNARRPSPLPMKIYVFLMSLGLITSTGTGVYMAFKYNRDRRILWGLLIAGTALPIGLLFI